MRRCDVRFGIKHCITQHHPDAIAFDHFECPVLDAWVVHAFTGPYVDEPVVPWALDVPAPPAAMVQRNFVVRARVGNGVNAVVFDANQHGCSPDGECAPPAGVQVAGPTDDSERRLQRFGWHGRRLFIPSES